MRKNKLFQMSSEENFSIVFVSTPRVNNSFLYHFSRSPNASKIFDMQFSGYNRETLSHIKFPVTIINKKTPDIKECHIDNNKWLFELTFDLNAGNNAYIVFLTSAYNPNDYESVLESVSQALESARIKHPRRTTSNNDSKKICYERPLILVHIKEQKSNDSAADREKTTLTQAVELADKHGYYACVEVNGSIPDNEETFIDFNTPENNMSLDMLYRLIFSNAAGIKISSARSYYHVNTNAVTVFYNISSPWLSYPMQIITSETDIHEINKVSLLSPVPSIISDNEKKQPQQHSTYNAKGYKDLDILFFSPSNVYFQGPFAEDYWNIRPVKDSDFFLAQWNKNFKEQTLIIKKTPELAFSLPEKCSFAMICLDSYYSGMASNHIKNLAGMVVVIKNSTDPDLFENDLKEAYQLVKEALGQEINSETTPGVTWPLILLVADTGEYASTSYELILRLAKKNGYYACIKVEVHHSFEKSNNGHWMAYLHDKLHIIYRLIFSHVGGATIDLKRDIFRISKEVATFYKIESPGFYYPMQIERDNRNIQEINVINPDFSVNSVEKSQQNVSSSPEFISLAADPLFSKRMPSSLTPAKNQGKTNTPRYFVSTPLTAAPVTMSTLPISNTITTAQNTSPSLSIEEIRELEQVFTAPSTDNNSFYQKTDSEVEKLYKKKEASSKKNNQKPQENTDTPKDEKHPISSAINILSVKKQNELLQLLDVLRPVLNNPNYASQLFSSPAMLTTTQFSLHEIIQMKKWVQHSQVLQDYLVEINQHPDLVQYFKALQLSLDNTVLSLKAVAGGHVEGTNITKTLIQVGQHGISAIGTLAGGPAGLGIGICAGLLGVVLNTLNEYSIQALATQVAGLFPNSSTYGNLLEALALVLTISMKNRILSPPPLTTLNPAHRFYLEVVAKFHGRSTFTAIDYLVLQHMKKIITFWQKQEAHLTTEQWLQELLTHFSIKVKPPLKISDMCPSQTAPIPLSFQNEVAPELVPERVEDKIEAIQITILKQGEEQRIQNERLRTLEQQQEKQALKQHSSKPDNSLEVDGGEQSQLFAKKPSDEETKVNSQVMDELNRIKNQLADVSSELLSVKEDNITLREEQKHLRNKLNPPSDNLMGCIIL